MSWAARITTAPGVELRVVFSEPVRQLDMTKDTARRLAGLILVAAEDREPTPNIELAEKPAVFQRATVARKELSGIQTRDTVARVEKPGVSRRHTVWRTSPQPKTAMNVSDTPTVCCCVVTRWERQENRGCPVHGEEVHHDAE
jgi:hypothetical protein